MMNNLKKRIGVILLVITMVFGMVATVYAEELKAFTSDIKLYLNGTLREEKVVIIDGSSYLPVRKIANMLGANVQWYEKANSINLITYAPTYQSYSEQNFATGKYIGDVSFTYDNGTVYSGGFKNGKFHGEGKIVYANGTTYRGMFIDGRLEGEGEYTALNGDTYKGQFKNNDFYGYGKYTYANGDTISGEFRGNKIDGVVHVTYKAERLTKNMDEWDGVIQKVDIYDITFNPNLYNGSADIVYDNGTQYDGSVAYNKYNGKGKITYPDGSVYNGQWVKDRKTGYGTYTFTNGEEYKGYFLDDKFEGDGTYYYNNGDKYDGLWKNDKKNGRGTMQYANGNKFVGSWKNGQKHTIDYKGGYTHYEEDYGLYIVDKDNLYDKNLSYSKLRDEKYYQKWDEGKLVKERKDD